MWSGFVSLAARNLIRILVPFSYSSQFRAMVINQVRDGKPVAVIAKELGVNQSTVFRWK